MFINEIHDRAYQCQWRSVSPIFRPMEYKALLARDTSFFNNRRLVVFIIISKPSSEASSDLFLAQANANGGPKRKPNSVLVLVILKNDAIGSEKPNSLRLGDSVPISQ